MCIRDRCSLCPVLSLFQSCMCPNRFLIHEDVFDEFVDKLTKKIGSEIVIGNAADAKTTTGPLINKAQVERVRHNLSLLVAISIYM